MICCSLFFFFFSSRRRHTRFSRDWSSDVCSSDLRAPSGRRRIAELERYRILPGGPVQSGQTRSPLARAALSWTERVVTASGTHQAVALELDRAGVALRVQ